MERANRRSEARQATQLKILYHGLLARPMLLSTTTIQTGFSLKSLGQAGVI